MNSENLYKFLKADGSPTHGPAAFRWPIPENGRAGDWVEVRGPLVACENGLHLIRESGLLQWAAAKLYRAEHNGRAIEKDKNVLVCHKARLLSLVGTWNDKNLRLFACDCAKRVLPLFEKVRPEDRRSHECIAVARRFALGQASSLELKAAEDAAGAAWAAARAAAWAAWAAAKDAAKDAAGATWTAAWAAEHQWQTKRLMDYLNGNVNF